MKRLVDILVSVLGLLLASPLLMPVLLLVWLQDFHSPFYVAPRVGKNGSIFKMVKIRSMRIRADQSGVDSTAANDPRITAVGYFVRRFKLDEITQLWNVLKGEMSLVGPRPNVQRDVALYTAEERKLLSIRPGITDFSSIVFSDEGEILRGHSDPDLGYNQLIRPWKSRLGLLYVARHSLVLDFQLIILTALAIISKRSALKGIDGTLKRLEADQQLQAVVRREEPLSPFPPPGAVEIVRARP